MSTAEIAASANGQADSADSEADYAPGSVGCHELLDRTSMLADMVEQYLVEHPACTGRPEWHALAERAAAALHELYQKVGAEHLTAGEPEEP